MLRLAPSKITRYRRFPRKLVPKKTGTGIHGHCHSHEGGNPRVKKWTPAPPAFAEDKLRGGDHHGWRHRSLMVIPAQAGIQAFVVRGGGPKAHDVFAHDDSEGLSMTRPTGQVWRRVSFSSETLRPFSDWARKVAEGDGA